MRTCFDSDRRASVSSGIDCASPPLAGSFSSDVSASRGSAYLGLSDEGEDEEEDEGEDGDGDGGDDDDDDGDDDDDDRLRLRLRHRHRYNPDDDDDNDNDNDPRSPYEPSKRQKLTSRSSPPVFSPARHLPVSLPPPYDLPEPEMTTSAHQRLQDVLSSTPAPPPRRTNPRRTNAPTTPHHQPPPLLKRSSSIRLSTSLEGKATVVLEEAPESPPSSLPIPIPVPASAPRSSGSCGPQRRIVDSKIWEFYCDNQAMIRSPGHPHLQPAEAKQALGLLRNKAKSIPLPPPPPDTSPTTITQQKKKKKKTPLARRPLHSSPTKAKKNRKIVSQRAIAIARPRLTRKQQQQQELPRDPGHESDKENRPPGAPVSPPPEPRRRAQKSRKRKRPVSDDARRILGDVPAYDEPPSSSQDAEMESAAHPPPVRVDEMECVENLLSLRGGTWR